LPYSYALQLLTPAEFEQELHRGSVVLDTRPPEQFAALHIRGSIQVSLMGNFASWAAIIIDPAQKIVLLADDVQHAREAQSRLARVGLGRVIGYALADGSEWQKAGLAIGRIPIERCRQIWNALHSWQLIDVRSQAEWLQGHLPGAISLPLLDLDSRRRVIDPSKRALVYCREGFRATTAASILLRDSNRDVAILVDGIEGWSALGLPLETT
jgi:rhodanese-related sulfurtransferase